MIEAYFREISALISASPIIHSSTVTYDQRSTHIGFIRGDLHFLDGSRLHFREFVNVEHGTDRYMYVYQYQHSDDTLIFRYDNAPHYPDLPSFPHHKHDGNESNVVPVSAPDLGTVLSEIRQLISTST